MSGGMPPFLQYAFMADIGTTVTIYQLFTERSNYKKRSLSRRSRRSSACPQIPFILCKPKVHYPAYNSTSLVPILRRMSPFHTLSSCFLRSILILSSYLFFFVALRPNAGHGLLILEVSRSHSTTHHSRQDSSGRVISSSQRPLPDNTQHSRHTSMAPVGFEPTIAAGERPQNYALDREAIGTGTLPSTPMHLKQSLSSGFHHQISVCIFLLRTFHVTHPSHPP